MAGNTEQARKRKPTDYTGPLSVIPLAIHGVTFIILHDGGLSNNAASFSLEVQSNKVTPVQNTLRETFPHVRMIILTPSKR